MPTTIHSTGRVKRGSSSVESQDLLVCLGLVFVFVLTTFGLSKLIGLLRTRRRAWSTEPATAKDTLLATPQSLYTLHVIGHLAPAVLNSSSGTGLVVFPRKPRPQDLRTGVIQYAKASPYLQHISAPRSYALRHRRRLCFNGPGPTPLRNVITATPHGKLSSSTVGIVQKSAARVLQKTHRTNDPLERPAFAPHPRKDTAATVIIEIPVCLDSPDVWSSVEHLHRTADAVVGAHPDARPLGERPGPATPRTSFLWAASSGVGANFKFGLVRGNNAGFGASQSPVKPLVQCGAKAVAKIPPTTSKQTRPLSDSRNANVKNMSSNDSKANAGNASTRKTDGRKENVAVC